jgi:hypothetical protein
MSTRTFPFLDVYFALRLRNREWSISKSKTQEINFEIEIILVYLNNKRSKCVLCVFEISSSGI